MTSADDYLERRANWRDEHLKLAGPRLHAESCGSEERSSEPADNAVLLFEGDSPAAAEAFAKADPYVREGLVTRWRVRPWMTVVGEHASNPIRFPRSAAPRGWVSTNALELHLKRSSHERHLRREVSQVLSMRWPVHCPRRAKIRSKLFEIHCGSNIGFIKSYLQPLPCHCAVQ